MPTLLTRASELVPGWIEDGVPPETSFAGTEACKLASLAVVCEPELPVAVRGTLEAISLL